MQQALLRLTVGTASADGSAVGGTVRAITNGTWSEAATTYSTRPAVDGAVLATRTAVKPKDVVDFDVTSGVAGDGTVNLAVVSSSSDWVRYASREATTGRPELRIALTENTPPVVTVLAPATAARVLPGSPVVFTAAAIDAEDGDLGSRIAWSSSLDGPLGTGPTVTAAALRPGLHTVTARVTDAGGLVGQATVAITVVHPPAVTIVAPADGTVVFTSGLPLTLTARATDVEDGDLGAHITWTSDRDGALGTGSSIAAGALTVGTHVIDATVTDADGLRGSTRISVRVRAPNVPPRVTITGPADGTAVPAGTPLNAFFAWNEARWSKDRRYTIARDLFYLYRQFADDEEGMHICVSHIAIHPVIRWRVWPPRTITQRLDPIGDNRTVQEPVQAAKRALRPTTVLIFMAGAWATVNSVWVLGWFGEFDKLAMTRRMLAELFATDIDRDAERCLYIGDSLNDAPMFGFFPYSVAVATVRHYVGRMPALPRWITNGAGGAGFVEIADRLLGGR